MAGVVTSVPFTLSGTVTLPLIGVVTGVSTSYSLQTLPAVTTPATMTTARGPLIDPPVRVTTTPVSSSTVSSSSARPSSSSVSSSSSSSSSTALQSSSSTSVQTSATSSSTSTAPKDETITVTRSSSTRSSSAASASASRAVAGAATKPGELSTLARSLIIAGAVVAGLIILALIVGFFLRRLRRKRRNEDEQLGSELQDQGGKGAYGGSAGYGTAAGGWGAGNDNEDQYHEKSVGAGAAGFGSGGAFANALGRDGRPASPAAPGALYGGGYAASDVSLHGQALGTDHMGGGGAMYGVDVGAVNNYSNLGHGYPPTSPYYEGQQHNQAAPGQYLADQGQQQPYGADAYSAYPAVPSTVALASAYPDQSYDNLGASATQRYSTSAPAAPAAAQPEESTPMRVVRGFQASLADELPIQPFTTLNLLQTYDDGWCLCEDPNTGRQGVVPRDCLAAPELVNGQMETGARALTPTAGRAASPSVAAPLPPTPVPIAAAAGPPAPVVDEKRALAAAAAMSYAAGSGSGPEEPAPIPYAEEDPNGPSRPLPTLPPPSFSESNLAAQASGSGSTAALPANEYPREKAVTLGAPLSTTTSAAAAAPPRLDLQFSTGAAQDAPAGGSGLPRLDTSSSLAVSDRQERRSSLMDSIAAAGAYLEGNGAPPPDVHYSHAQ